MDMRKYGEQNDGFSWILTSIEILSHFAFTVPIKSKERSNTWFALIQVFEEFH